MLTVFLLSSYVDRITTVIFFPGFEYKEHYCDGGTSSIIIRDTALYPVSALPSGWPEHLPIQSSTMTVPCVRFSQ